MKKIVVLTGSGISAESGIKTFRDSDGLWEEYKIEDVAIYDAWLRNPEMVQDFYNQRRKQLYEANPNEAHFALAKLEQFFEVQIITQNIDDLHERGGSTNVIHLHGELKKSRSTADPELIYDINGWELKMDDLCEKGSRLRPHIVWFGEAVPLIEKASELVAEADIFIVTGTSLQVYPAAGLLMYAKSEAEIYLVDPNTIHVPHIKHLTIIKEKAGKGIPELVEKLIKEKIK